MDSGRRACDAGYQLKEGEIKPTRQRYRVWTGQEKNRHFGLVRLDPERPPPMIIGDTGCTTAGLVHPYEIRKLSIAGIKAVASYPEEFHFVGSYRAGWAQVGNSVPRFFVKAIAEQIRRCFLSYPVSGLAQTDPTAPPIPHRQRKPRQSELARRHGE